MRKIKEVLSLEISMNIVNWEKLEKKIYFVLEIVNGDFKQIKTGSSSKYIPLEDAVTFKTKDAKCIKLFSPRLKGGNLWCSGIQNGLYNSTGKPILDENTLVRF